MACILSWGHFPGVNFFLQGFFQGRHFSGGYFSWEEVFSRGHFCKRNFSRGIFLGNIFFLVAFFRKTFFYCHLFSGGFCSRRGVIIYKAIFLRVIFQVGFFPGRTYFLGDLFPRAYFPGNFPGQKHFPWGHILQEAFSYAFNYTSS